MKTMTYNDFLFCFVGEGINIGAKQVVSVSLLKGAFIGVDTNLPV